jgi:hypothetical protein
MSDDEFGDGSFLEDFDADQAVLAAKSSNAAVTSTSVKRRKISTSPSRLPVDATALRQTLQTYFGYSGFRPGQLDAIQGVLSQRDVRILNGWNAEPPCLM